MTPRSSGSPAPPPRPFLWERRQSALALRAGVYQGDYTAGFEWRLGWFRLGLASYAEEQGAYAGQDRDRRYVLGLDLEL